MKRFALLLVCIAWLIPAASLAVAEKAGLENSNRERVELVIFSEPGCPYCKRAKAFLKKQQGTRNWLSIREYDVSASAAASDVFRRTNQLFGINRPGVPLIVTGGRPFLGFDEAGTTGAAIMAAATACRQSTCQTLAGILSQSGDTAADRTVGQHGVIPEHINVPFWGEVPLASLSLPALTIFLAAIDGFNPCAMWVLVFLVGLLAGMQDRLRMWFLGGAFLLTSGLVYFGFLAAWLNVFLLIGALLWVRLAVGCVALASGAYYLHAFATDAAAECKVTNLAQRRRIMDALRASVYEKRFLLAVAGIVVLAVAVNLIELLCSAGIPAVFTDVLAMTGLPSWQRYLYLLLYVLVFMLDDAAIFVIAMMTLAATGMTSRYLRLSHLLGGIGMIGIGTLLLFAPDLLNFSV
jgi:glutaredoxin